MEETKMRKLGIVLAALACLSLVVPVASAAAFNWGVGANLGLHVFSPDYPGAKSITEFGWPTGGVRFSFTGEKPMHEVYFESALSYWSSDDASMHTFTPSLNYQFNFDMKGPAVPYVTAGAGAIMWGEKDNTPGAESISATSMFYGGGVGIAHHMGNGCGRLRAEIRYDMVTEGKKDDAVLLPKGGDFGFKLGFDLWDKK